MDYLVEMYDETGAKVYNFRQTTPTKALLNLAELADSENDIYPFRTATCYRGQKIVWEVEIK